MGASAKTMLYGRIVPAEVQAALEASGYRTEVLGADEDHTRVFVYPPDGGDRRTLWVFGERVSQYDNADVYPGERTACSMGSSGHGPEIVRILAEEFGGYHLASDGGRDWVAVEGRRQVELSPEDALRAAFQRALPPDLAAAANRALGADPERLAGLRDALDAYLDGLATSPRP